MGNVYKYVEDLCSNRGIKISRMCADIKIRQSIMSDLKYGRTQELSVSTSMKIAEYFDVSPLELMGKDASENYYQGYMDGREDPKKNTPLYSSEAMRLAKDYDGLDLWGRRAVRELTDIEMERMEDESRFSRDAETEPELKIINLFDNPSAAGPALGETGQGCQPYELKPEDPQGASYAIRVQGNSMEPDFKDGSIVFVNHDEMRDGDIGIFCVNGSTVIKQWHYDPVLGITYLFSLNRKRADADVVLAGNSGASCVWQGRVMTKRRYDLPGM